MRGRTITFGNIKVVEVAKLWQNKIRRWCHTKALKTKGGNTMKKIMSLVVILSMILAPLAFAASPWTAEKTYGDRVTGKLVFGLQNTLLGWIQLFAVPNQYASAGKNVWSGIGQGLVEATVDTVGGALQLVTFPIPADLPLPQNGVDLSGGAKK